MARVVGLLDIAPPIIQCEEFVLDLREGETEPLALRYRGLEAVDFTRIMRRFPAIQAARAGTIDEEGLEQAPKSMVAIIALAIERPVDMPIERVEAEIETRLSGSERQRLFRKIMALTNPGEDDGGADPLAAAAAVRNGADAGDPGTGPGSS